MTVDRRSPQLVDLVVAVVIGGLGLAEIWVPFSSRSGSGSAVAASAAVLLSAAALTQRRRHPLATMIAIPLVWTITALLGPTYVLFVGTFVPIGVALFSVARSGRGRTPYLGALVGALILLGVDLFVPSLQAPGEIAFHWAVMTLVWLSGWGLRRYAERARAATERAVRTEVEATQRAMSAVIDERTRIAREMHDIVGHALSAIIVSAGAAEDSVLEDPQLAADTLGRIRTTGVAAMAEMRHLVVILRDLDVPAGREPQPRLDDLPALVATAVVGGLRTSYRVDGEARPLPAGVDLALYRVVQESLTNVRKHARATHADVVLGYAIDQVTVEVRDDGVGSIEAGSADAAPGCAACGAGVIGMRERVALYDGQLEAGPCVDGGYAVRARIPVAS